MTIDLLPRICVTPAAISEKASCIPVYYIVNNK